MRAGQGVRNEWPDNVLIGAHILKLKRESLGWQEGVIEGTFFPRQDCPMENAAGCESLRNLDQAVLEGALWIDAEADELCGAKRYERSVERFDARWLRVSPFGLLHA
jgi:hypothetical protein